MSPSKESDYMYDRISNARLEQDSLDFQQQHQHLLSPVSIQSAGSFSVTYDTLGQPDASLGSQITQEVKRLTKLSVPLFIQNFLAYSTTVVAVAFVGHLNHPELLSSAVLANSLYNVTGYSLLQGLASGMESLCGQAFGGRSYKTLGLVLQRALLINWAMCIPITLLWTHSEKLLLLLGQQPSIAAGASLYLRIITPTLYTGAVVECLKRYLLAQRVVVPGMVVTVLTCLLAPLYNWLFIFRLHMGLAGAALAFTCSQATTAVLLTTYTVTRDARMAAQAHEEATWCKPSMAMFAGWGAYLSYGLPATIQLCTEWWMYEVVIFMAGMSHNAEIGQGVMGLLFQISALAYMSALAYGSSVNTRVGNELGAGNADAARLAVYTCVVLVAVVQSLLILACKLGDRGLVGLLTNNLEVEEMTIATLPVMLATFVTDALNCVAQGILRGAGRPGIGAVLNSAGYWGLGVPLAAYFGLYLQWSVKGFWAALAITSGFMSVVQFTVIFRFDWHKEVQRAAQLMAQHEDQAADGKAADMAAAMRVPVVIRAVSSSCDALISEGSYQQQRYEGSQEDGSDIVTDTAPLLDAGRVSGASGGSGGGAQLHSGAKQSRGQQQQQQLRVSDQGVRQPSRLSRVSQQHEREQQRGSLAQGEQQHEREQQRGSLDGVLARAWLQWPFARQTGRGAQQQQQQLQQQQQQQSAGQAATGPLQQLHQQSSLTRGLLRSNSSIDRI